MSKWKECRLGEVAEIVGGATPSTSKPKYWSDEINWVTAKDISDCGGYKIFNTERKISQLGFNNCSTIMLPSFATVLIARGATMGKSAMVASPMALNQTCYAIIGEKELIDPFFLSYFIKSSFEYFVNIAHGAIFNTVIGSSLRDTPILLPPLPEQHAIAGVLSSLDDKIDLLHRQNKTLEAMAETLFRQWFVEEADEGWEEGKLPDEFDFTMGQSPPGITFNEYCIGLPMFQGNADFGFRFPTERIYTTEPTRIAEPLDTLISVRAPVGAQNMALTKCCIGRGVATFRYRNKKSFYTYTYFKLHSLTAEIKQFNTEGTVFGSISKSDLEEMDVVIPSIDDITNFENEVKPINDKIICNCKQIAQLGRFRDFLLPKLLSGVVEVYS